MAKYKITYEDHVTSGPSESFIGASYSFKDGWLHIIDGMHQLVASRRESEVSRIDREPS